MKRSLLALTFMIAFSYMAYCQKITGKITDATTGKPLPEAAVINLKTGKGAFASEEGAFTFELPAGKHLVEARFLGYASQRREVEVAAGQTVSLNFALLTETIHQQQIVVTANKLGMNRDNIPMNVAVVNQREIEQSSESNILPIISAKIPGVFISERGVTGFGLAGGSAGKISIRGVGGGDASFPVLLLIDGQPQFMGMMGHAIPDSYVASDVEKVEVVKGPASILYGTSAMGGAINLITARQKEEGLSAKARIMYGSFNTQKYSAKVGYHINRLSVLASYNHDQTDGDRPNSDFNIDNGYLKLGYEFNNHFSADANISHSSFKAYDPGSIYAANPSAFDNKSQWVDIDRTNVYFTLSNKFDKIEGGLKGYYMHGDHDIYDGWKSNDENKGISIYQGLRLFAGNLLHVGFDLKQYGGRGISPGLGSQSGNWINVKEAGGYAIVQQKFFEHLTLNAGIRYDNHSVYGGEWVPQLGAAYSTPFNSSVRALISKGFRNPTVRELYLFPPANSSLLPETMWNYDLTYSQNFPENRGKAEVTVFIAEGENLIMTAPNPVPPPPMKNQNTGAFSHKGFELDLRYRITNQLNVDGSYSYLHMDTPKVAAPKHQLFISGNYHPGKFDVSVNLQHIGDLYTRVTPANDRIKGSYTLLNSKVSYAFNPHVTLFVAGENLLHQAYQIQYGYPMPGITLFAGINLSL